jgi:hypothetical protein
MMKKRILIIVATVLVIAGLSVGGVMWANRNNASKANQVTTTTQQPITTITYKGKAGVTALALLQQAAKVDMTGTGDMAYVTAINGSTADTAKKQYWEFDVNGAAATVGAGTYVTKDDDSITWKLSSY